MSSKTTKLCVSGLLSALSLAILLAGLLPGMEHLIIFLSTSTLMLVMEIYGYRYWAVAYLATSLLGFLIIPNLDVSLTFACMAWYPLVDSISYKVRNRLLGFTIRFISILIASIAIYHIAIFVFGASEVIMDIPFFVVGYVILFMILFGLLKVFMFIFKKTILKRLRKVISRI